MFKNKSILVTGGTGSFGKKFIYKILKNYSPKKVIIYSRDELKQSQMMEEFKKKFKNSKSLRFFLGDVRDYDRLSLAFQGVDYVVHAAALKQVPAAEYNPTEFIQTNIRGAENVIKASLRTNVRKILDLRELINKFYEKVSIELDDNYNLEDLKKVLKEEGKTQINIVVKDKNKTLAFQLEKTRKFDFNIFNDVKNKQYVKKISF